MAQYIGPSNGVTRQCKVWSHVGLECARGSLLASYPALVHFLNLSSLCVQRPCHRAASSHFMNLNPPFWPSESQAIYTPLSLLISLLPYFELTGEGV